MTAQADTQDPGESPAGLPDRNDMTFAIKPPPTWLTRSAPYASFYVIGWAVGYIVANL